MLVEDSASIVENNQSSVAGEPTELDQWCCLRTEIHLRRRPAENVSWPSDLSISPLKLVSPKRHTIRQNIVTPNQTNLILIYNRYMSNTHLCSSLYHLTQLIHWFTGTRSISSVLHWFWLFIFHVCFNLTSLLRNFVKKRWFGSLQSTRTPLMVIFHEFERFSFFH